MNESEFLASLLDTGAKISISLIDSTGIPSILRVHIRVQPLDGQENDKNATTEAPEMKKVVNLLRRYISGKE